nr:hypothetical protein [Actinomycetota bacterium]
ASAKRSAKLRDLMGLVLAITAGLIAWVILWSLGAKSIDAFMVTILFALLGVTGHMLVRYLPGRQE